ncbi:MAG TPA: ABC transporter permease, partial [Vicinamibacterales bacterium]
IHSVDPIERRYAADHRARIDFRNGDRPWFLLGSDALGRDVLSRVLEGARLSLGVALLATALALAIGALAGAVAGYMGGWLDALLMHGADFILVLPTMYVALALRGALPNVLGSAAMFVALAAVLALVGWPSAARGVRGIVSTERHSEYAEAARALGASSWRVIWHHLLPSTRGFLIVQAIVLLPVFVVAEATLSFVGLGFAPPAASWGSMLRDAASAQVAADTPWLLAPAAAIVLVVLVVHTASAKAASIPESYLGD